MQRILARRREEGTLRELRTPEQDKCFVDFTSNDYLGLGRAADLREAIELEETRARKVGKPGVDFCGITALLAMRAFASVGNVCTFRFDVQASAEGSCVCVMCDVLCV